MADAPRQDRLPVPPFEAGVGALAGVALLCGAIALHVALAPGPHTLALIAEQPLFWPLTTAPLLIGGLGWIVGDRRRERQQAFELYQRAVDEQFADLAEREWVTRAVVQNAFDAVLILDLDGAVLDANPMAARIFGHELDHLVTVNVGELLPDHDRLDRATVVERRTAGGERLGVEWRTRARHADGSVFPIDLHISMLADPGLLVYAVREASTRVSREARLVREAVTAEQDRRVLEQRRRGTVLMDVGGSLREQLDRVLAQAELLEAEGVRRELVQELVDAGHRALERIEQLWNLTMWERASASPTLTPVSVTHLVDQVTDAVAPLARHQGVRLHVQTEEGIDDLVTDAAKLSAVIRNLVGQGCRRARSEVRVEALREPGRGTDWLAVIVHDDGEKLTPEALDAVFLAFAAAESPLQPTRDGQVSGVALAQRLARGLGGHVAVESDERGSSFSLRVPMDSSKVKDVQVKAPGRMDSPPPSPAAEEVG